MFPGSFLFLLPMRLPKHYFRWNVYSNSVLTSNEHNLLATNYLVCKQGSNKNHIKWNFKKCYLRFTHIFFTTIMNYLSHTFKTLLLFAVLCTQTYEKCTYSVSLSKNIWCNSLKENVVKQVYFWRTKLYVWFRLSKYL